jgi:hypothetical protein
MTDDDARDAAVTTVSGGAMNGASEPHDAEASRSRQWRITVDERTGLVTKLEKLSADGTHADMSYEGLTAMALAYGVPPEVVEVALSAKVAPQDGTWSMDPAVLAAWQTYASIPSMLSYWQGYADGMAAGPSRGLSAS